MNDFIKNLIERLTEVEKIVSGCSKDAISFEQAHILARFFYDYQATNNIIDEAEKLAHEKISLLREYAEIMVVLTSRISNELPKLNGIEFEVVAMGYSKNIQKQVEEQNTIVNSLWLERSSIGNRLDYGDSSDFDKDNGELTRLEEEHKKQQGILKELYDKYYKALYRETEVSMLKFELFKLLITNIGKISRMIIIDLSTQTNVLTTNV